MDFTSRDRRFTSSETMCRYLSSCSLGMVAVQNAVDKPGDGGHGGFQLVGDIGDKAAPGALGVGEGVCHVVKGEGQLAQLVGAGDRTRTEKSPAAKGAGRGAHLRRGCTSR